VAVVVWLQYGSALWHSLDEILKAAAGATVDLLKVDPTGQTDPDVLPLASTLRRGRALTLRTWAQEPFDAECPGS
jgi:hypothetical protein